VKALRESRERSWATWAPEAYRERRLEHYNPAFQSYAGRLLDGEVWCLLLTGGVGSGKTSFAYATAYEWHVVRLRWGGLQVVTPMRFSQNIGDFAQYQHDLYGWSNVGLLVFDDIGAVKASEGRRDALLQVVSARCDRKRPTILTSNLTLEQIGKEWDALDHKRLASRLGEGVYVNFGAKDRRKDRK
jgi:DNA replication protein DnaC